jgi:hypothetical protein
MRPLVACVIDQDAAEIAGRVTRADINGHVVVDLREHALLQQEGHDLVADLPLELTKFPEARGYDHEVQQIAGGRRHHGNRQRRARQGEGR